MQMFSFSRYWQNNAFTSTKWLCQIALLPAQQEMSRCFSSSLTLSVPVFLILALMVDMQWHFNAVVFHYGFDYHYLFLTLPVLFLLKYP